MPIEIPMAGARPKPTAALTAYTGIEDRRRAIAAGYQMHISKPDEPDELTKVVANLAQECAEAVAV